MKKWEFPAEDDGNANKELREGKTVDPAMWTDCRSWAMPLVGADDHS